MLANQVDGEGGEDAVNSHGVFKSDGGSTTCKKVCFVEVPKHMVGNQSRFEEFEEGGLLSGIVAAVKHKFIGRNPNKDIDAKPILMLFCY